MFWVSFCSYRMFELLGASITPRFDKNGLLGWLSAPGLPISLKISIIGQGLRVSVFNHEYHEY